MRVSLPALLLILLTGGACAGAQVRSGLVELDERQRTVLASDTAKVLLGGPLADELGRVVGAQVKVWGSGGEHTLRVQAYQILDVGNGFYAIVGWITVDQGGVQLTEWSTGLPWTLTGVRGDEFDVIHGAKVWVTGLHEGPTRLRPVAWGLLTDPP